MAKRLVVSVVLASTLVVGLAACTPTPSPTAKTGGSKPATTSTATFSGSSSGKAVMNLCTDSGADSIFVTVDGTTTQLPGVVSKTNMDFDGKDSIYTIDKTGPLPQFSTDGNTVTLDGVKLKSVIDPTKSVTFSGKVTCP